LPSVTLRIDMRHQRRKPLVRIHLRNARCQASLNGNAIGGVRRPAGCVYPQMD